MFYNFPYQLAGFSHEDWEELPRGDRVIIRDYYLNGMSWEQTLIYDEYETSYQVRKVEIERKLEERPKISIRVADFRIPCSWFCKSNTEKE